MNGSRIDWDAARARLARAEATLAQTELTDTQRDAIFARRAEELAAPPPIEAPADALEVLVFEMAGERYAFPSQQVREIRPLSGLTPLPATPAFVAGLINVRGRIVPVLDLRSLFGLPASVGSASTALLLSSSQGDVGILTVERPAIARIREGELGPLPAWTPAGLDPAHVRGVTEDFTVLLDGERLLADSRLLVNDES